MRLSNIGTFDRYKFASYDLKPIKYSRESSVTRNSSLGIRSLHPDINEYIGVYTSSTVREKPTARCKPLNLKDVNKAMQEYSKKVSFVICFIDALKFLTINFRLNVIKRHCYLL